MRGIASNEDAAFVIRVGGRDPQLPEPDMVEFDVEVCTDRGVQMGAEIEIVFGGVGRNGRVEEPGCPEIDAAEELPISLQIGMQDVEEGFAGESLQQAMQLMRAEHQEHHQPVMVREGRGDASLLTDGGAAAVAADDIRRGERPASLTLALGDLDPGAVFALANRLGRPAIEAFDRFQLGHATAQHRFGGVLWQAFIVREVERAHQLALQPIVMVAAEQRSIGRHAADAVVAGNGPRCAQLFLAPPEMQVLHGALGQILAFGDRLRLCVALDESAADAALAQLDCEAQSNRTAADDEDLCVAFLGVGHRLRPLMRGSSSFGARLGFQGEIRRRSESSLSQNVRLLGSAGARVRCPARSSIRLFSTRRPWGVAAIRPALSSAVRRPASHRNRTASVGIS